MRYRQGDWVMWSIGIWAAYWLWFAIIQMAKLGAFA